MVLLVSNGQTKTRFQRLTTATDLLCSEKVIRVFEQPPPPNTVYTKAKCHGEKNKKLISSKAKANVIYQKNAPPRFPNIWALTFRRCCSKALFSFSSYNCASSLVPQRRLAKGSTQKGHDGSCTDFPGFLLVRFLCDIGLNKIRVAESVWFPCNVYLVLIIVCGII